MIQHWTIMSGEDPEFQLGPWGLEANFHVGEGVGGL